MEKSNSKTPHEHGSGNERNDRKEDEQATSSNFDNYGPEQIAYNMNDLKALDFNSADDVRQAMKAVLAGKLTHQAPMEEVDTNPPTMQHQREPAPMKIYDNLQNTPPTCTCPVPAPKQQKVKQNRFQKMKTTTENRACKGTTRLKRRGRPPKAGPSKEMKKPKYSSMYLGRLANVVSFSSESDSDGESVVIYY